MPVISGDLDKQIELLWRHDRGFQVWLRNFQRGILMDPNQIVNAKYRKPPGGYVSQVRAEVRDLNGIQLVRYKSGLYNEIYMAGARSVNPLHAMSLTERQRVRQVAGAHIQAMKMAREKVAQGSKEFLRGVWADTTSRRKLFGTSRNRRLGLYPDRTIDLKGIKSVRYSDGKQYTVDHYAKMQANTVSRRLYNEGAVQAAVSMGHKYMKVSDGANCGWTSHNDGDTANGKIVTVQEALAYPIAHPHCVRSFAPSKKGPKEKKKERELLSAKSAAKFLGGALVASEATNLAAMGLLRLAETKMMDDLQKHLWEIASTNGSPGSARLEMLVQRFRESMLTLEPDEEIRRIQGMNVMNLPLNEFRYQAMYPGNFHNPMPQVWDHLKAVGDGIIYEGKRATGATKNFLTALVPGAIRDDDRIQLFASYVKRKAMERDSRDNVLNLISEQAKRRNWFEKFVVKMPGVSDDAARTAAQKVDLHWSRWGPRFQVFASPLVRVKGTFTDTGWIHSLVLAPTRAVRGTFRRYQGGNLGGHISLFPKKTFNGIFRAIVEVDERGQLVGNLRLVPGGPLRLRLEFASKIDKDITKRVYGTQLSFDPKDIYQGIKDLGRQQVMGELQQALREMEFKRVVIDYRIFNASVLDISGNLRIPIKEVRSIIRDLEGKRLVERISHGAAMKFDDVRWRGLFVYATKNPEEIWESIKDVTAASKEAGGTTIRSSLFGNIRFSSLTSEQVQDNPFLRALKSGSMRFLTKAHLDAEGLQSVATNMRIFGWNVYDIGNVLSIRAHDVVEAWNEGLKGIQIQLVRLHIRSLDDAMPAWDENVELMRQALSTHGHEMDRVEAISEVVTRMKMTGRAHFNARAEDALHYLAGIVPTDSKNEVQLKLLHLRNWMRVTEAQDGIVWRGVATDESLELGVRLSKLTDEDIREKAEWIFDRNEKLLERIRRLRPAPNSVGIYERGVWRKAWDGKATITGPYTFEIGDLRFIVDPGDYLDVKTVIHKVDPELIADLTSQAEFFQARYPGVPLPIFRIGSRDKYFFLSQLDGVVNIPLRTLEDTNSSLYWVSNTWSDYAEMSKYNFHHTPGEYTHLTEESFRDSHFLHEFSHYLTDYMSPGDKDLWLEEMARVLEIPPERFATRLAAGGWETLDRVPLWDLGVPPHILQKIEGELGSYALSNIQELMAESMAHYWNDLEPGETARTVGTFIDGIFDSAPRSFGGGTRVGRSGKFLPGGSQFKFHGMDVPASASDRFIETLRSGVERESRTEGKGWDFISGMMDMGGNKPFTPSNAEGHFQSNFSVPPAVRSAMEDLMGGRGDLEYDSEDAAIAVYLRDKWLREARTIPHDLFRGVVLSQDELTRIFRVGNDIDLPMVSWAQEPTSADTYVQYWIDMVEKFHGGEPFPPSPEELAPVARLLDLDPDVDLAPVIVRVKGAKGIELLEFARDQGLDLEDFVDRHAQEVLSEGKFRVMSVLEKGSEDYVWPDGSKTKVFSHYEVVLEYLGDVGASKPLRPSPNRAAVDGARREISRKIDLDVPDGSSDEFILRLARDLDGVEPTDADYPFGFVDSLFPNVSDAVQGEELEDLLYGSGTKSDLIAILAKDHWTMSFDKVTTTRAAIEELLGRGTNVDLTVSDRVAALWMHNELLNNPDPFNNRTFRGVVLQENDDLFRRMTRRGFEFDLPASSVSEDEAYALQIIRRHRDSTGRQAGGVGVVIEFDDSMKGIRIEEYARFDDDLSIIPDEWMLNEGILEGKFEVVSSTKMNSRTFLVGRGEDYEELHRSLGDIVVVKVRKIGELGGALRDPPRAVVGTALHADLPGKRPPGLPRMVHEWQKYRAPEIVVEELGYPPIPPADARWMTAEDFARRPMVPIDAPWVGMQMTRNTAEFLDPTTQAREMLDRVLSDVEWVERTFRIQARSHTYAETDMVADYLTDLVKNKTARQREDATLALRELHGESSGRILSRSAFEDALILEHAIRGSHGETAFLREVLDSNGLMRLNDDFKNWAWTSVDESTLRRWRGLGEFDMPVSIGTISETGEHSLNVTDHISVLGLLRDGETKIRFEIVNSNPRLTSVEMWSQSDDPLQFVQGKMKILSVDESNDDGIVRVVIEWLGDGVYDDLSVSPGPRATPGFKRILQGVAPEHWLSKLSEMDTPFFSDGFHPSAYAALYEWLYGSTMPQMRVGAEMLRGFDPVTTVAARGSDRKLLPDSIMPQEAFDAMWVDKVLEESPHRSTSRLYRGASLTSQYIFGLVEGDRFSLPASSFSGRRSVAFRFMERAQEIPTVIVIENTDVPGIDLNKLMGETTSDYEHEWIVEGRFEVVSVKAVADSPFRDEVLDQRSSPTMVLTLRWLGRNLHE